MESPASRKRLPLLTLNGVTGYLLHPEDEGDVGVGEDHQYHGSQVEGNGQDHLVDALLPELPGGPALRQQHRGEGGRVVEGLDVGHDQLLQGEDGRRAVAAVFGQC